jgi:DeoR family fructose operon transcriptional repressor
LKVLTEERYSFILEELKKQKVVKLAQLNQQLDASESTIRRDLEAMEQQGLLTRIHGGAKLNLRLDEELSLHEKSVKNVQQKEQIAQFAASLVERGDVIYLDAGTTTQLMIPHLQGKEAIVVTNSVHAAVQLADLDIHTIILGGRIKLSTKAILGSAAATELKRYYFNKAFLGMNAAHEEAGYTTPDPEEAALKRLAIEQAQPAYVLLDTGQLGQVTFAKVADLSEATMITEKGVQEQ